MASVISAGTTSTTALNLSGDTTGILQLQTNGTTAAMTIDTSQNVGIGATPSAWSAYKGLNIGLNATLAGSTGGSVALLSTNAYFDGSSYKYITTDAATQYQQNTGEHIWRTAASGSAGATLTFSERMRINSGGQLLVGTTTGTTLSAAAWRTTLSGSGNNLAVVNSSTDGSTTSGFQSSNYTVSGGNIINFYNGSGTFVAAISIPTNSSTGTTVTYGTGSDYRLKENVAPMTGALSKVQQLKPVTYTWKSNGYSGQGFIAHELQEIVPDCVVGEKDAVDKDGNIIPQMIDTSFLVATLTAAIQELNAKVEAQAAEIQALKGAR